MDLKQAESYSLNAAEFGQWDDTSVLSDLQVHQVKWRPRPQADTGKPDQDSMLETLSQVWLV